jgi:hypothetical protein
VSVMVLRHEVVRTRWIASHLSCDSSRTVEMTGKMDGADDFWINRDQSERVHHYEYVLVDHRRYIQEHGVDPQEITEWRWHR